jgi:hypothetical protein
MPVHRESTAATSSGVTSSRRNVPCCSWLSRSQLVPLLDSAQDGNGIVDARLPHHDRLEPPFERAILLDMLAVLVERGRSDAPELPTRQRRLEHVRGVLRAFGRAGPHDRVKLVDE